MKQIKCDEFDVSKCDIKWAVITALDEAIKEGNHRKKNEQR
jgi:hypothetical protein